uniref:ATP synthase complex subunit 8 n=1 Tax=Heterocerus fenestratus TaxID=904166 RepID=I7FDD4_9COLE|nr:ATP synthase F0 subunit 8 [Heterocerus fenestratus]
MPQMAPISWLELMLMFSLTLVIFNNMNFFIFKYYPKSDDNKSQKTSIKWKW